MPLFDFFKKKEKEEKKEEKEEKTTTRPPRPPVKGGPLEKVKKVEKKEKPEEKVAVAPRLKPKKQTTKIPPFILKEPHISEKATGLVKENQYVFKVYPAANKTEIKKAIESLYGVDVLSVNLIKIPSKRRRLGRTRGFKKGYKKAIIKIKKGQKIEVL